MAFVATTPMKRRMSRRDHPDQRCTRCHMLSGLCVCALIPEPRLETRTRLVLFIHRFEDRKPTNTGRLATECLANSEVIVRGQPGHPDAPYIASPEAESLLLFPSPDATPLAEHVASRPVTLIVPDGSWRQASKVRNRVPGMREIPCVWLPQDVQSTYRLRHEAHPTGLATIEAIARAFELLEGGMRGTEVRQQIERVFNAMVERTLWSRGQLKTSELQYGAVSRAF